MKKLVAGVLVALSLTACGASEPREVTPQSCITALDINSELFSYLGDGDIEGYIEYGRKVMPKLQEAAQDCRSKAVDTTDV